jgi:hypothetical protein
MSEEGTGALVKLGRDDYCRSGRLARGLRRLDRNVSVKSRRRR